MLGCQTAKPKEDLDVQIWRADKSLCGVTRFTESIHCSDERFPTFVCLSKDDLAKIYSTCLQSKRVKWYQTGY